MLLKKLLTHLHHIHTIGSQEGSFDSVTHDSRCSTPSSIFVAIRGDKVDGRRFAPTISAAAVIADAPTQVPEGTLLIMVENARLALAQACALLYRVPSRDMFVIGLTGTNGKSTTACILEYIFHSNHIKTGLIGTIGHRFCTQPISTQDGRTTPEASTVQPLLSEWKDNGAQVVIMEVSSIGLAWHRVDGIYFSCAMFTNFSRDHLDFHDSMEDYLQAKRRLFTDLVDAQSTCILNHSDLACRQTPTKGTKWLFSGSDSSGDLFIEDCHVSLDGTSFVVHTPKGSCTITYPLIGSHNIDNVLCAIGGALSYGLSLSAIQHALSSLPPVPGRLERARGSIPVFIDYAHSPDALSHILQTLRPLCAGKLITVFGCGGDRDKGKRPIMGRIAQQHSDICVVTSDNPRSEHPQHIISDILEGMTGTPTTFVDRKEAISFAIATATKDDVVVIAGKGHECYQEIQGVQHPFDDKIIAQELLSSFGDHHEI